MRNTHIDDMITTVYIPYGHTIDLTREDNSKRVAIFHNKINVMKQAWAEYKKNGTELFGMKDLDVYYNWGLEEMEKFMIENPDHGLIALYTGKCENREMAHVSSQFVVIRARAIEGIEKLTYERRCFCSRLADYITGKGYKVKYFEKGSAIES